MSRELPLNSSNPSASAAAAAVAVQDLSRFETYEEYLDAHTTAYDMQYLQDEDLARKLVELGYRGSEETLKR